MTVIISMGIFLSLICVFLLALEKPSFLGRELLLFSIGSLVCQLGYYHEYKSVNLEQALTCVQYEYFGIVLMTGMTWMFMTRCCKVNVPKILNWGIAVFSVAVVVCIGIGNRLNLFYSSVSFDPSNTFSGLKVQAGWLFYIYAGYTALIYTALLIITIRHYILNKTRDSLGTLLMGLLYPVLGAISLAYMLGFTDGIDVTPFSMAGALLYHVGIVYRFRLFDSMQMAKDNIIQGIQDAFLVVDTGKQLLYANPNAKHLFPDIKLRDKQADIIGELMQLDKQNLLLENRWYQIYTSPFHDRKQVKGYLIWLFDKTEEYESTTKLVELKNQAEQANKIKSEFLQNITHEFRTPLNAILGMAELLIRQNESGAVTDQAGNIKKSGETLLAMIDDILGYTNIEAGNYEMARNSFELKKMIRKVVDVSRVHLADKPVELIVKNEADIPSVLYGNEAAIRQVLMKLMSNAVKYTERGTIRLEITWKDVEEAADITFRVTDTGRGIKEDIQEHLFDPFLRADVEDNRSIGGTGLGLAICKNLVDEMGGSIGYTSRYGEGSSFYFTVPSEIVDITPMGRYRENSAGDDGTTIEVPQAKIMVVDDNATNLRVAKGLFQCFGVDISVATGGRECLAKVGSSRYDIIFMDYLMPDMDGVATMHRIRSMDDGRYSNIPVVAFTANATAGMRERFVKEGFVDFIPKPLSLRSLERILLAYLPEELVLHRTESEQVSAEGQSEAAGRSEAEGRSELGAANADEIPGIDMVAALELYGGKTEQLLRMMQFFCEDGEQQADRMRRVASRGDTAAYVYEIHALKGLARGIGAGELAGSAEVLEMKCKSGNVLNLAAENAVIEELYREVLGNVTPVLLEHGMLVPKTTAEAGMQSESKKMMTEEELRGYLARLWEHLTMLEANPSKKLLAELTGYELDSAVSETLTEIADRINEVEFEEAEKLLKTILR